MPLVLQAAAFNLDSDTEHDFVLPGPITPGTRIVALFDNGGTVSAAAPLGGSGTVDLVDFVADYVGFGTNASVYEIASSSTGNTGIRFTVSGGGAAGAIYEVQDSDGADGGIVVRGGGGDPDLDIDLTTSADDSIGLGFWWAFGFADFTPDANTTEVPGSDSTIAAYSDPLGTAGAHTVGGTLDTGAYNYGFGIAYLDAAGGGPSFNPAWARNANQVHGGF